VSPQHAPPVPPVLLEVALLELVALAVLVVVAFDPPVPPAPPAPLVLDALAEAPCAASTSSTLRAPHEEAGAAAARASARRANLSRRARWTARDISESLRALAGLCSEPEPP
jgi:hypothetical protein